MFYQTRISLLFFCIVALVGPQAYGQSPQDKINVDSAEVAIKGYDTVAYFTEGKPMKGNKEFAHTWQETQWFFATADHRDRFASDPVSYTPQFGGFCAMAMSRGKVATIDPEVWTIVEGKLYLNFSKKFGEKFRNNSTENIKKAEAEWDKLQQ